MIGRGQPCDLTAQLAQIQVQVLAWWQALVNERELAGHASLIEA